MSILAIDPNDVAAWLDRHYVAAPGARLRREERQKCAELVGFFAETAQAIARVSPTSGKGKRGPTRPLTIVDAAAGKAYLALLLEPLVLAQLGRKARVVALERSPRLVAQAEAAAARAGLAVEFRTADVADASAWPDQVDIVLALHACADASDATIAQAIRLRARHVLLAPCCVANRIPAAARAREKMRGLDLPRSAGVRRPLLEALVMAERVSHLEHAGYRVEVTPFAAPTVTPHNLLIRGQL